MNNFLSQFEGQRRYRPVNFLTDLFLIGLILLCSQTNIWAAKMGNNALEKVHISADHMQLNLESGYSVYTGNVKISQGELVLTGDEITLEQKNNEIERLTVIGKPARYNHVAENGETIKAQSEHMVYTASQNKLVLTINASLQQTDHQVSSQKITYDTVKGIIIAGDKDDASTNKTISGDQNSNKETQRVNITLTPKKQIQQNTEPPSETAPSGNK